MDQKKQLSPGISEYTLDTAVTRKKFFQNRIDYDILLKPAGHSTGIGLFKEDLYLGRGPAKNKGLAGQTPLHRTLSL